MQKSEGVINRGLSFMDPESFRPRLNSKSENSGNDIQFVDETSDSTKSNEKDKDTKEWTQNISPIDNQNEVDNKDDSDISSTQELSGVEKARKLRELWSRKSMYIAYTTVFLLTFVLSFQMQVYYSLYAYAISSFRAHSLVSTISTVASIVNAVMKPPLARVCDVFGRLEAFTISVVLYVIGLLLIACCKNVQTYAGGVVMYNVGYSGMEFIITVFLSDTSSLASRPLMIAINSLPFVVTVWIGPLVGQAFYKHSTWRWGIGSWCIIVPVCALPFFIIFWMHQRKATKLGLVKPATAINPRRLFHQFDVIGIFFMTAGFCLLLITLTLAGYNGNKWRQARYIVMFVLGGVFIVFFVVYEIKLAKYPSIPFRLMREPTIAACCTIAFLLYFTFYCWDNYLTSFLQVVHYTTINSAGHIANTYSFGACATAIIVGILVRVFKRQKIFLLLAVPLTVLGQALMIRYRGTQYNWAYQVMPQIFVALAGGTIMTLIVVCMQSVVKQEYFAILTALLYTVISTGGAVGSSISGTIWINMMPSRLKRYLPDAYKNQTTAIFESLVTQLSYPRGSDARNAIIHAYEDVQRVLTIVSTAFSAILIIPVWFVANPKLSSKTVSLFEDEKQRRGQIA
ncbi:siderophore iron transporter 1 [Schizosaccharomyces japonicus yFS275]|uniref:Siderophore iron transporter 1 n=1 Tax=Schizosaccharomyces japonicus (strain yFS275 / FY16936) TaxID=402676 RepID=B6K1A9_SCHJY|nr:siderophore iron transporter 1 [Schizosaccharomyces japonicus yFS275]EEB07730.2 siderophore iron transporter 1 [Schizosaccharomyces japonicus yFS275]